MSFVGHGRQQSSSISPAQSLKLSPVMALQHLEIASAQAVALDVLKPPNP